VSHDILAITKEIVTYGSNANAQIVQHGDGHADPIKYCSQEIRREETSPLLDDCL
jgi:hypothetical protein